MIRREDGGWKIIRIGVGNSGSNFVPNNNYHVVCFRCDDILNLFYVMKD